MSTPKEINSNSAPPERSLNELPLKTFKLKDLELKIFQGEKSIIYHATEIEDLTGTLYKAELNLEELYNLNSIFRAYTSIEKVFTRFFQKLVESKIVIKKEENKITLTIIIEFMGEKDEAKIILIPEKTTIDNIVMKLCDKVKEIDNLNKIIVEQKNIIEKQQKEFSDFKNYSENKFKELEALKKESESLKSNIEFYNGKYMTPEEYNKLKEKVAKFKEAIGSNIMRYNELNLIETGVQKKLKKKIKKYTLLFKASRDGYRASNFHSKCDGYNNTLTLVETQFGRRFGGFTDAQWDQSSNYKTGSNGFIFSFNEKEIYYNKDSNYNIYGNSGYGPCFGGGHDFYINDNCNTSKSGENSGHSYETNGKKYALSGSSNFIVKDYEVYQLELE